jgi:hypothetical protein
MASTILTKLDMWAELLAAVAIRFCDHDRVVLLHGFLSHGFRYPNRPGKA